MQKDYTSMTDGNLMRVRSALSVIRGALGITAVVYPLRGLEGGEVAPV